MTEENKEKETPQEDVNKKVIKKPSVKIKKSFVLALIACLLYTSDAADDSPPV